MITVASMLEHETPDDAPFDLSKLLQLVELMEKHGLTEVSLQRGDQKWKLRRGPEPGTPIVTAAFPSAASSLPNPGAAASPAAARPENDGTVTINSPTVGTFYSAATPDDPPFVSVGTPVQPETTVCIVEAMKVFNQIPAEVSGTVVAVLVNNGDSVEFGQPLFRVRPG